MARCRGGATRANQHMDVELSLIFPALDEEEGIVCIIHEAQSALNRLVIKYQIIVVNDVSRDGTEAKVETEMEKTSLATNVHVAERKEVARNGGMCRYCLRGFRASDGHSSERSGTFPDRHWTMRRAVAPGYCCSSRRPLDNSSHAAEAVPAHFQRSDSSPPLVWASVELAGQPAGGSPEDFPVAVLALREHNAANHLLACSKTIPSSHSTIRDSNSAPSSPPVS